MTRNSSTPNQKGPYSYRNWKTFLEGAECIEAAEYPLYTDARIKGELVEGLGPYQIFNAVPNPNLKRIRPTLVLRAESYIVPDNEVRIETDAGSYHGGYIQDEIAALVSIRLGIRLRTYP